MQINIATRHGHLSQASQEKIADKVQKLSRLFERLTAANVIVNVEHPEKPEVEIRVSAELHDDFVAADSASALMAAVDGTVHKLEQQLRKHKDKLKGAPHAGPPASRGAA